MHKRATNVGISTFLGPGTKRYQILKIFWYRTNVGISTFLGPGTKKLANSYIFIIKKAFFLNNIQKMFIFLVPPLTNVGISTFSRYQKIFTFWYFCHFSPFYPFFDPFLQPFLLQIVTFL
jgi:hypothetical protein